MSKPLEQYSASHQIASKYKLRRAGATITAAAAALLSPEIGQHDNPMELRAPSVPASAMASPEIGKKPKLPVKKPNKPKTSPEPVLVKPESLPGSKIELSDTDKEALRQSTVKIVYRPRGSEGPFYGYCTGDVITTPFGNTDDKYVMTAGHCFDRDSGAKDGLLTGEFPEGAINIIDSAKNEYAVADPQDPNYPNVEQPIGLVSGLSVSTETDAALLRITPVATAGGRSFNDIPAIRYEVSHNHPVPGQKVGLYGLPWFPAHDRPIVGEGTYLKTITLNLSKPYKVAIVAINSVSPDNDSCEFGASGSLSKGANFISGPLSRRVYRDYDAEYVAQFKDGFSTSEPAYHQRVNQIRLDAPFWLNEYEKTLNVDLSDSDSICMFTEITPSNVKSLVEGLATPQRAA